MAGLQPLHWLIVVMFLGVPVVVIAWALSRARRRAPDSFVSAEARLLKLRSLKADGLITEAEYEQRRRAILSDI